MANCGCTDTTPCTSQECGCKFEVDAGCVRYTGDTLSCIDAQTGDLLSDILLDLNTKFCNLVEGNFIEVSQEVAGANCDGGGIKIVVKNINTLVVINTEYLCIPDVTNFVIGSGKADRVTRWTPIDDVLGESIISDDGNTASIGTLPSATNLFTLEGSYDSVVHSTNNKNGAFGAVFGSAQGSGAGTNHGSFFSASNSSYLNIGTYSSATSVVAGTNVGIKAIAENATLANYAILLQDPSVGVGKVLTCMTGAGHASWQTFSGISGSGTLNYIPRWTPNGSTLGNSTIQDNGVTSAIGSSPNSNIQFYIDSNRLTTIYVSNTSLGATPIGVGSIVSGGGTDSKGFYAQVTNATGTNIGGLFTAGGSESPIVSATDIGVKGTSRNTTRKNIGGLFEAIGINTNTNVGLYASASGGSLNYSAQFIDSTEGVGKVLTCMTSDGKAQWATPSATGMTWTTLAGVSPSATLAKNSGYIIRDITGSSTGVTLPAYGTCSPGDKIEISAAGELISSLANWTLTAGNASDKIYGSFVSPNAIDTIEIVKNGPGVLFTFNGITFMAPNPRKISLTLLCIKDTGTAYHWQILHSTSWHLV